jgi:hypothetical protein
MATRGNYYFTNRNVTAPPAHAQPAAPPMPGGNTTIPNKHAGCEMENWNDYRAEILNSHEQVRLGRTTKSIVDEFKKVDLHIKKHVFPYDEVFAKGRNYLVGLTVENATFQGISGLQLHPVRVVNNTSIEFAVELSDFMVYIYSFPSPYVKLTFMTLLKSWKTQTLL